MADVTLRMRILGDSSDGSKALKAAGKDAEDTKKRFAELGNGLSEAGARMAKVITIGGAVGPAILAVGSAASAATAGVSALVGAIGPAAVAGAVAYAGAMAALSSSTAVVSFGFANLSDAMSGTKGAMDKLSPPARAMVTTLKQAQKGVESIRVSVQKGLFPGVTDAVQRLSHAYFPMLRVQGEALGRTLGHLASQGAKMATTGIWRRDAVTLMHTNTQNVSLFGRAGLQLADALRSLMVVAAPLTTEFARFALHAAQSVNAMVQAGRASGSLASFFSRASANAATFGHILGDVAVGLFNIFRIGGGGQGAAMLTTLQGISAQFRAWTQSSSGIKAISDWFEQGRVNLMAMGRLTGSVGKGLASMGSGKQLAPLIDQINSKIIPPLMDFLRNASVSGALNSLVGAIGSLLQVLAKLEAGDKSVKAFAVVLNALAQSAAWLITNIPGAGKALGLFLTVAGGAGALKFIGLGGVVDALGGSLAKLAVRLLAAAGATDAETGAVTASAVASKAWAGAQWLLNAALDANPIGIVVVAIAAFVAGIIIAYKHSETFRNIVNGAFTAIRVGAGFMWTALKGYFRFIIDTWLTVAGTIVNGAAKAFGWVPGLGSKLRNAADWFNSFRDRVNAALDGTHSKKTITISTPGAGIAISQLSSLNNLLNTLHKQKPVKMNVTSPGMYNPGQNANGTSNWRGGMTWVGERGPELVNLPRGSQVHTAAQSARMAQGGGVAIHLTVNGAVDAASAGKQIVDILDKAFRQQGIKPKFA